MVTECTPMVNHRSPELSRVNMEPTGRPHSPSPDKVSSAADAMLKLSASAPNLPVFVVGPEAGGLAGSLPVIGQPPVAYMAQQHDNASTKSAGVSISSSAAVAVAAAAASPSDTCEVKPDITKISLPSQTSRMGRKQREFIPDYQKDDNYWMKRRKNNEAAKRSREKRRMNDMAISDTISQLRKINDDLRRELQAIKFKFGLPVDQVFPYDPSEPLIHTNNYSDSSSASSPQQGMASGDARSGSDTNTDRLAFPTPSPLQEALRLPPKSASPTISTTPQVAMTAATIPFLIPVPISTPQPMALVSGVSPSNFPVNPTVVTSLTVPSSVARSPTVSSGTDKPVNGYNDVVYAPVQSLEPNTNGSTAGERDSSPTLMDAGSFHAKLRVPEICQPISPETESSSRGSLHIVTNSASSASDYSECDTSDEHDSSRGPLNLCKRESSEGAAQGYIEIKPYLFPTSPSSFQSQQAAIPHKLRHKLAQHLRERSVPLNEDTTSDGPASPTKRRRSQLSDGEAANSDASNPSTAASGNGAASTGMSEHIMRNNRSIDPKYAERRQRNNQAARKCRENRKVINEMRIAKSSVLETENQRLKEELQNLTSEVSTLKGLIEKKNAAKAKGEPFEPPELKKVLECKPEQMDTTESGK